MKKIDILNFIDIIEDGINSGKKVEVPVAGNSMMPFLKPERDIAVLAKIKKELKKFDAVFYKSKAFDKYVLHRIIKVNKDGSYGLTGDNHVRTEKNVKREDVIAIMTEVKSKGKQKNANGFYYNFLPRIWYYLRPFRKLFIKSKNKK